MPDQTHEQNIKVMRLVESFPDVIEFVLWSWYTLTQSQRTRVESTKNQP